MPLGNRLGCKNMTHGFASKIGQWSRLRVRTAHLSPPNMHKPGAAANKKTQCEKYSIAKAGEQGSSQHRRNGNVKIAAHTKRDAAKLAAKAIESGADSGIGGAQQRHAFLDRTHLRLIEMLPRADG